MVRILHTVKSGLSKRSVVMLFVDHDIIDFYFWRVAGEGKIARLIGVNKEMRQVLDGLRFRCCIHVTQKNDWLFCCVYKIKNDFGLIDPRRTISVIQMSH